MKEQTDASFGIIPVRKKAGGYEVLLIHQFSNIGNNSYWVFPKGHAEGNELPLEAAKRELFEETGLAADHIIESPVFSVTYSFVFAEEKILKTVDFYIGYITNFAVTIDQTEVKEAGWYSTEQALKKLDYADTKNMFQEVITYLEKGE